MWTNTKAFEFPIIAALLLVGWLAPEFREIVGGAVVCLMVIICLRLYYMWAEAQDKLGAVSFLDQTPWDYQHKLMLISDQELPNHPKLTRTSILYGALILEESGETMLGLAKAIEEASKGRSSMLFALAKEYAHQAVYLDQTAKALRKSLEACTEFPEDLPMSLEVAREIVDGCTDLHVVTCGLSLSTGLPGMDAYEVVAKSNLSKANPVTGRIDKTPDGKWIKGANYKAPDVDLDPLLTAYYTNPQL